MRYLRHTREIITGTHVMVAGWLLVAVGGSGLAVPDQASAAAIRVTSLADTTGAGDGACTLREAITNANADSAPVAAIVRRAAGRTPSPST